MKLIICNYELKVSLKEKNYKLKVCKLMKFDWLVDYVEQKLQNEFTLNSTPPPTMQWISIMVPESLFISFHPEKRTAIPSFYFPQILKNFKSMKNRTRN